MTSEGRWRGIGARRLSGAISSGRQVVKQSGRIGGKSRRFLARLLAANKFFAIADNGWQQLVPGPVAAAWARCTFTTLCARDVARSSSSLRTTTRTTISTIPHPTLVATHQSVINLENTKP
ncbi:unnamed protein product, partial [Iphiclides podalirius]